MKQPKTSKLAFIVEDKGIEEREFFFDFYGGFALSQKQKTIKSFHDELIRNGIDEILEISRKSNNPLGSKLSAFNLMIEVQGTKYPVECVYQSSKVFSGNIQFKEVINESPLEAKRKVKENQVNQKLEITSFNLFGIEFPISPKTFFYDYIYNVALYQNPEIASEVVKHICFTDIEFNHKKQFASQARSCAIYKYLYDNNLLETYIENPNEFLKVYLKIISAYQTKISLLD